MRRDFADLVTGSFLKRQRFKSRPSPGWVAQLVERPLGTPQLGVRSLARTHKNQEMAGLESQAKAKGN